MKKSRKSIAKILLVSFILTLVLPTGALFAATTPSDIQGHWAESTLVKWSERGLITGFSDGTLRPDQLITRAEFISLANNAKGYTTRGTVDFNDVNSGDWFYNQLAVAMGQGYITGYENGNFGPGDVVTRAQAAVMVAKMQSLAAKPAVADNFADASDIPTWAKGAIGAVADAKIMVGNENKFSPNAILTRAEAVSTLDRIMGQMPLSDKDVTVTKSGTSLKDQVIEGNLIIDKAVGNGDVTLDKVTVKGQLIVQGGGMNSIYIKDCTINGNVVAEKTTGDVRLVFQGKTTTGDINVMSGVKLDAVNFTGSLPQVTVDKNISTAQKVTINVPVTNLDIKASANVDIKADVANVTVAEAAKGSTIDIANNATVKTLTSNAKIDITGNGDIGKLEAKADGITTEITPDNTVTAPGVEKPSVDTPSSGGGGGGSSSGGGSTTTPIAVSAVTVHTATTPTGTKVPVTLSGTVSNYTGTVTLPDSGVNYYEFVYTTTGTTGTVTAKMTAPDSPTPETIVVPVAVGGKITFTGKFSDTTAVGPWKYELLVDNVVKSTVTLTLVKKASPLEIINAYSANPGTAPAPTLANYQAIASAAKAANVASYNANVAVGKTVYTNETLTTLLTTVDDATTKVWTTDPLTVSTINCANTEKLAEIDAATQTITITLPAIGAKGDALANSTKWGTNYVVNNANNRIYYDETTQANRADNASNDSFSYAYKADDGKGALVYVPSADNGATSPVNAAQMQFTSKGTVVLGIYCLTSTGVTGGEGNDSTPPGVKTAATIGANPTWSIVEEPAGIKTITVDGVQLVVNYVIAETPTTETPKYTLENGVLTIKKSASLNAATLGVSTVDQLIIADSVGNGDVTIDGITVTGTTTISGGGPNSVTFTDCDLQGLVKLDATTNVSVKLGTGTAVDKVVVSQKATLESTQGSDATVAEVTVATAAPVTIAAPVSTVVVDTAGAQVKIDAKVDNVNVSKAATITVGATGEVATVSSTATGDAGTVTIGGTGKVENILAEDKTTVTVGEDIKGADGETPPTVETAYAITVTGAGHATVSVPSTAKAGAVNFTVIPQAGYVVKSVKATDADGADVSVTGSDGNYSFTMPAKAVKITVTTQNTAKAITAFSFAGLTPPVTAVIDESAKTIKATVPTNTDLTALVATFVASADATVKVGSTAQVSGTTANDFTNAVSYVVTAEDGSIATYAVTVTKTPTETPVTVAAVHVYTATTADATDGNKKLVELTGELSNKTGSITLPESGFNYYEFIYDVTGTAGTDKVTAKMYAPNDSTGIEVQLPNPLIVDGQITFTGRFSDTTAVGAWKYELLVDDKVVSTVTLTTKAATPTEPEKPTVEVIKVEGVTTTPTWTDENTITIAVNGNVTYANNTMDVAEGGLGEAFYNAENAEASMLDADGKPLANRKDGQFTALSVNLAEVMTGLGITGDTAITKIVQTNPALEMYDGIDGNVSKKDENWVKDKTYQGVTVSNIGDFSFLLLNGDTTATIVISYGTASELTINVTSDLTIEVVPPTITATVPETITVATAVTEDENGKITGPTPNDQTPFVEVALIKGVTDYSNVRVVVTGVSDKIQLIAEDTEKNWYNIAKSGWGPGDGFALADKTTKVYIIASEANTYTATVQLVDVSDGDAVLATATFTTTAEGATTPE